MPKNKLVSPFLKWAGGKRQLLDSIVEAMPRNIGEYTYVEPFIGGGAVLLHLEPRTAVINDFNAELINVYRVVRDHVDELIEDLARHRNEPDYFYAMRSLDRSEDFARTGSVQRASRFIYLNKTCFNGLYRVNRSGAFNTPFGRYKNPTIVNEPTLRAVSAYLNTNEVQILNTDYNEVLAGLDNRAFVYLDPPYHPLSESSSFTGYVQGGWGEADQIRLRRACDDLNARGIRFLQSNSASEFILNQYRDYRIDIVRATRAINANAAGRGAIDEVIIRNYD